MPSFPRPMKTRHFLFIALWPTALFTGAAEDTPSCCDQNPCEHVADKLTRFTTVQEVVDHVFAVAPAAALRSLKKHSKYDFLSMNFGLDEDFERRLALKDGNVALIADAGAKNHRRAWRNIRVAIWEAIQEME
ncbi:MAG: hypothetical protein SynsKO_19650 [Synoicihabitans sp.]